ncbi:hypothetical protein SCRM01_190 [Synechococcus phage S-CRM01]|uniref:hypothetical protein n=1 Tax=Synechococcus phage S-CRM01 TaxID=1026955 RepID=UPI000209E40F|nr:hypothetical protein SCRM01_190 [Synechococcus phage S-CRM01]AEC53136.1 hypothetical protein SCRM01_190 [Synechococcus phage S-CRM01]
MTKAFKIEVLVVDLENVGEDEICSLIENARYIYPNVLKVQSVDVGEWSDNHPLNKRDSWKEEVERLFPKT